MTKQKTAQVLRDIGFVKGQLFEVMSALEALTRSLSDSPLVRKGPVDVRAELLRYVTEHGESLAVDASKALGISANSIRSVLCRNKSLFVRHGKYFNKRK